MKQNIILLLLCLVSLLAVKELNGWEVFVPGEGPIEKLTLSEDEWRARLQPQEYSVLREQGTERAFSHEYNALKDKGVFCCAACGLPLFDSKAKYDSGTGWPSFWEPYAPKHLITQDDYILFYKRTEVRCARCDSHIGHIFEDGPEPTGQRWCMNSVALRFVPQEEWDMNQDQGDENET